MKHLVLILIFASCSKAFVPVTAMQVAHIFAASAVTPVGKGFDVTSGVHTYDISYNGKGEYRVYEMVTDSVFGEHFEPTELSKYYQALLNEKRK